MPEPAFWSYVSTKAACDPVKSIFLCVPQRYALHEETCKQFAEESGWVKQVEEDGDVLIVPVSSDWRKESKDLLFNLYRQYRNSFRAPGGHAIPGRDGIVWTWETMIELIGYEEGADFAGNVLVKHPNMFANAVLIDGGADDFASGDEPSDHWLVNHPSADYHKNNKDIPVSIWLLGSSENQKKTENYFIECNQAQFCGHLDMRGIDAEVYANPNNPACRVLVSKDDGHQPELAGFIMYGLFKHVIRWKNSPDGTLRFHCSKKEFYDGGTYMHGQVEIDGLVYPYAVYLPEGMKKNDVKGLPLLFSIHGRGEPAWIFAQKNGWEDLADETKGFVLVLPDSPENIWTIERDYGSIEAILNVVAKEYEIDRDRVYITGFSNGAVFTDQQMTSHPQLFAAASPWNGPSISNLKDMNAAVMGSYYYEPHFAESGYEMPVWICVGDNDNKAGAYREDELDVMLPANGCLRESEKILDEHNCYTADKGFKEGNRLCTRVFSNETGSIRVGLSVVKNMPHGAISDEARAAWMFMKRFRRVNGEKKVTEE